MDDVEDPAARLQALVDQLDGKIAAAFRNAITQARSDLDLDELADLIEQGRIDDALSLIGKAPDTTAAAINDTFVAAGRATAAFIADAGIVPFTSFDQVNERAVRIMQANRLDLIREFTDEQRRATQSALVDGAQRGLNPRDQARNFRNSVGLTERQQQAVANYRRLLNGGATEQVEALNRALHDGRLGPRKNAEGRRPAPSKPLTPAQIDTMVQRYSERYIKYRAEVIGRTEALRAVHEGTEEMYRQAIESGDIDAASLIRRWVTTMDGRERATHEELNGVEREFGVPWETVNGTIRYPGDPEAPAEEVIQCRCSIATRILRR